MSVIIKDMKMPKKCGECPIVKFDGHNYICRSLGYSHKTSVGFSIRMTGCPLVELPEKHGRLVDADAFAEHLRESAEELGKFAPQMAMTLEAAIRDLKDPKKTPTIVEAEGEK